MKKIPCFVHIPKTGGCAIRKYVEENKLNVHFNGHARKLHVPAHDHHIFTVVRHPYHRYVSAVNYISTTKEHMEVVFRSLLKSLNIPVDLNVITLFSPELVRAMNIFGPQSEYLTAIPVDKVYRHEEGLSVVVADLLQLTGGQERSPLEVVNRSRQTYTVDMLTEEQRGAIRQWYADDFRLGGYE